MVISLASRSASRMISSYDLRRISPRSRGFFAAQAGNAALAASTAALASSTVALATEATLFSVAGSMTSKRPPSEDLRHFPPIHSAVGTVARRLSYMALMRLSSAFTPLIPAQAGIQNFLRWLPAFAGTSGCSTLHRPRHPIDNAIHRRQRDVFENIGGGQRDVRRRD